MQIITCNDLLHSRIYGDVLLERCAIRFQTRTTIEKILSKLLKFFSTTATWSS